jgi:hypothetical protein
VAAIDGKLDSIVRVYCSFESPSMHSKTRAFAHSVYAKRGRTSVMFIL